MLGDKNKRTSINPFWIILPAVLILLLVVGLGVGAYFAYHAWQAGNAQQAENSNVPTVTFPSSNTSRPGNTDPAPLNTPLPAPTPVPIGGGSGGKVEDELPPPPKPRGDTPKTISGGVLNGKAISLPKPVYPPVARAAHVSGTVVVQVTIDETGRVVSAEAVSGHPLLQAAAVSAARSARFSPTLLSGQPVKVTGTVIYNFSPN